MLTPRAAAPCPPLAQISEMDFHDSFLTLGLPEEHNKLLLDVRPNAAVSHRLVACRLLMLRARER